MRNATVPTQGRRGCRGRRDRDYGRPQAYKMKERMFSVGDDYFIEDEEGKRAFKVDGKMLRLRSTLIIRDSEGHERAKIQEKWMGGKGAREVEGPQGGA